MKQNPTLGPLLLAGAVLLATAAPLKASTNPQRDSARSTRPSSSSGSVSSGGSVSRSRGSRAVSRAPSSSSSRGRASVTRPPAGRSGGVARRGGGSRVIHRRSFHRHGHLGFGHHGFGHHGFGHFGFRHFGYPYFGFGFGYPFGYGYYLGPYAAYPYGAYPYGGYRRGPGYEPGYRYGVRYQEPGAIDLNVKPKRTEVYVDGALVGSAGQFDGFPDYLWLTPGSHEIVLYRDGYVTQRRVVEIRPAWVADLRVALASGETIPPNQVSRPVEGDDGGYRDQSWRERD